MTAEMTGRVQALLAARDFGSIANLRPLAGGEFSRAFAFDADGRALVVRVSEMVFADEVYAKDAYAAWHFAGPGLPIPRVVARGQDGDLCYTISERAIGDRMEVLSPTDRRAIFPTLLDTLDAIAAVDLRGTRGYGNWTAERDGDGELASWHDFLVAVAMNRDDGFYQDWHALFTTSFLERDLFDGLYRRMLQFAAFCPEARHLLHCDLHYDNILSDGQRITAIIDWGNACYGDPLYDVAWLGRVNALGETFIDPTLLDARYGAAPHYRERIACYELALGLDDLRFYAKTGRREQYEAIKAILLGLIAAPG